MLTKSINGTVTNYAYNANDQLTTQGNKNFTYDANGNLVTKGNRTYEYDDKNRLIKTITPTNTIEYAYDANDNRVAKTTNAETTTYLIDTNTAYAQVITESKEDGTEVNYSYGNDLISDGTNFFLTDALGSTRGLVDTSETLTDSYSYTPYGILSEHNGTSENSFLYTGEQFDQESEDYFLRARYYSPNSSRFLSRDTYDGTAGNPITQNHYAYGNSNPVMYRDPSGNVGIIEVQFNMSVQSHLRTAQSSMLQKAMTGIARDLGCDIAINFAKDMLIEGVGLYLVQSNDNKPYVGRTNNFKTRLRVHVRKKIGQLENILGRVKFHKMELSSKELNVIEELLIRAIDDMTGTNLSGMNNDRYNYGPGSRDPRHGRSNTEAFNKLLKSLKKKCKNGK